MVYCKYCAELLPDKAVKCGKCGADIDIYDGGQTFFEDDALADWDKELVVEEPEEQTEKDIAGAEKDKGGMLLGLTAKKLVIMLLCDIAAIVLISLGIKVLVLDKKSDDNRGMTVTQDEEAIEPFEETVVIDENSPVFPANGKFVVRVSGGDEGESGCPVSAVLINGNRFYSLLHAVSCLAGQASEENFKVSFEDRNGEYCSFGFDGKELTFTKNQNTKKTHVTAFRYENVLYVSEGSLSEIGELLGMSFEIKREYALEDIDFELVDNLGEKVDMAEGIKLDKNSTLNEKLIPVRSVLEGLGYKENDGVFDCDKEWKVKYSDGFVVFYVDEQRQIKLEALAQADGEIYISEYELSAFSDALGKNNPNLSLSLVKNN